MHYAWDVYVRKFPGGLEEHPSHYKHTTRLGKAGVVVPDNEGMTRIIRSHAKSTSMVTRVGSSNTMQLRELLEKHKMIAAKQVGRANLESPAERIRAMLLVAAAEDTGSIELPPSLQRRGWKNEF